MIQIIDLFNHLEIPFKSFGKNVSAGWIEISCYSPWCSDPSEHMGVNLSSGGYNCWVCGEHGYITGLIMSICNLSYREAKQIIQQFSDDIVYREEKKEHPIITGNILPKEASHILPDLHRQYLIGRGFDPDYLQRKYNLMSCYTAGDYSYRLIIPIVSNRIVVNFTSRDVSGLQEAKYKHCPNEKALIPIKDCLYNIDTVKDSCLIVEGPTDVWRIGIGTVATMGTEYTSTQLSMLANKNLKEIYIMFDEDAIAKAEKLATAVSAFCSKVEIIEIEDDPGNMTDDEANKLRKEINL